MYIRGPVNHRWLAELAGRIRRVLDSSYLSACAERNSSTYVKRPTPRAWTTEEDELLRKAVASEEARLANTSPSNAAGSGKHAAHISWTRVADLVGGDRTNRGCRVRWATTLLAKTPGRRFTKEEDRTILELQQKYGKDYVSIANELGNGRTPSSVRERLLYRLDPSIIWTRFSPEEDAVLRRIVEEHGENFILASQTLKGRTKDQCAHRWCALMPGRTVGSWSPEEDKKLLCIYNKLVGERGRGRISFGDVAKEFGTRNRKQCYQRYRVLTKRKASATHEHTGSGYEPTP